MDRILDAPIPYLSIFIANAVGKMVQTDLLDTELPQTLLVCKKKHALCEAL